MAVLHIDEVCPAALGNACRDYELVNDPANFVIAQHRVIVGQTELAIQEWMAVQDLRLHAARIGPRKASGMRQLESR